MNRTDVTIEILTGMDGGTLEGLENAYLTEIGAPCIRREKTA